MEDFDANIEDQKEEAKKDTAEEEESELVGDTSAIPNKLFINVSEGESQSYKCQPIDLSSAILTHMFLVGFYFNISRRTLMIKCIFLPNLFLRIREYVLQTVLSVEHGNVPLRDILNCST